MAFFFTASISPFAPSTLLTSLLSSSSSTASNVASTANLLFRLHKKPIGVNPKLFNGLWIPTPYVCKEIGLMIVKAVSGVNDTGPDGPDPPSDGSEKESMPTENLPLESKLQLKLERKVRMKLAKKIRLRRKRLLRKRRLRKKGRWPPSKLKKNKNV